MTPALAGKIKRHINVAILIKVDPRTGGETPGIFHKLLLQRRWTPALAGKTRCTLIKVLNFKVDPRTSGENVNEGVRQAIREG